MIIMPEWGFISFMRIALAHSSIASRGGGERFVLEAALAWRRRHDVTVYAWDYAPEKTFPEFGRLDVNRIGRGRFAGPLSKFLSWSAFKPDADAVSAHGFPSHFSSFRHPAVVYYLHIVPAFVGMLGGGVASRAYARSISAIDASAVKKCAGVAANSAFTANWAMRHYGLHSAPIIHPGIHASNYRPRSYGNFALFVGRLTPEKRVLELLRAWSDKSAAGLKLVVAGTGDEAFVEKLREEASQKQIQILSAGISDTELNRLYADCRCLVLPSHDEPFGMVLLEAMASGKPVVARASGGPAEIIVHSKTGFLAASDGQLLASVRKLAGDSGLAKRMGAAARKRASGFDWSKQLPKLEKMLVAAAEDAGKK